MNPFWKYMRPEDHLQYQVCKWISMQYPGVLYYHVPNEGRRTPFERFLIKILGIKSGVPDLVICEARGGYHGLYIELKAGKNKPTANQNAWLKALSDKNYYTFWSNDLCKCADEINRYFEMEKL